MTGISSKADTLGARTFLEFGTNLSGYLQLDAKTKTGMQRRI